MEIEADDEGISSIFVEPADYRKPEEPHRFEEYALLSGEKLNLRLVGSSPLWGHYLWNGARTLSNYLQENAAQLVRGRTILEVGAGGGLPSIVAGTLGASEVIVTDYPDADLIANLRYNVEACRLLPRPSNVVAEGYLWGASTQKLREHLQDRTKGFDVMLLADLLFNHHCHDDLASTIVENLARTIDARALVFFTPYRPWLLHKDMTFFANCERRGLLVQKVLEEVMENVMFQDDQGDELLRRTVYGYELKWPSI